MIALASVMQVDFPSGTARWADGGFAVYDGNTFAARDPAWGVAVAMEEIGEGIGDEIPGFRFACAPALDNEHLFDADNNGARVRLWTLELDADTLEVADADLAFDGMIGGCEMTFAQEGTVVQFDVVSRAERFFLTGAGNRLDPTYHKAMWLGEKGEDNATGLTVNVAWGAKSS